MDFHFQKYDLNLNQEIVRLWVADRITSTKAVSESSLYNIISYHDTMDWLENLEFYIMKPWFSPWFSPWKITGLPWGRERVPSVSFVFLDSGKDHRSWSKDG